MNTMQVRDVVLAIARRKHNAGHAIVNSAGETRRRYMAVNRELDRVADELGISVLVEAAIDDMWEERGSAWDYLQGYEVTKPLELDPGTKG